MSIKILEPMRLDLTENSIDENYPSIHFKFIAHITQYSSNVVCDGAIYIDYNALDKFVLQLKAEEGSATLADMDERFNLEINFLKNQIRFLWFFSKQGFDGRNIKVEFSGNISEDVFFAIKKQFIEYPKWW